MTLRDEDGRVFFNIAGTVWATRVDDGYILPVLYCGSVNHGGGIRLKPLFAIAGGELIEASTGCVARGSLADKVRNFVRSARFSSMR